jgi:hypothetical protein
MKWFFKINGKTHPSFYNFMLYNGVANIFSGINATIGTRSMLEGSGVGNGNENVLTILINLSLRDIIGQVASVPIMIKFAKIGDVNAKRYLKTNTLITEGCILIESMTHLLNPMFFPIVAAGANIGKNVGFTGSSSFNANIINKLSIDKDNISEIYSKITSLSTISFSIGMLFGLIFVYIVPCSNTRIIYTPLFSYMRYISLRRACKNLI